MQPYPCNIIYSKGLKIKDEKGIDNLKQFIKFIWYGFVFVKQIAE